MNRVINISLDALVKKDFDAYKLVAVLEELNGEGYKILGVDVGGDMTDFYKQYYPELMEEGE